MRLFSRLYQKIIFWAKHRHAENYLAALSFAESSFFPIPPDFMLAPMVLAQPQKAWRYATVTTLFSVLGGIFGYLIGWYFYTLAAQFIEHMGYAHAYQSVEIWFAKWGWLAVFIAGFSPIPYKLFTIGAGAVNMAFLPFVFASIVGRGSRFFLVSTCIYIGGERLHLMIERYIDRATILFIIIFTLAYILYRYAL